MKILLLGYGKMGKTIEEIANAKGYQIVEKIDVNNKEVFDILNPENIDVAIEFSQPDAAYENIKKCLEKGIKVISGTTGWLNKKIEIDNLCREKNGTFFYASNFSIGVNLFFKLNEFLARLIRNYEQYDVKLTEVHHTEKKDAPSGTAITLAEGILNHIPRLKKWERGIGKNPAAIGIKSIREGKVPGTHSISYISEIDEIEIKHEAFSRKGFAVGAIMVAEWIKDKSGVLNMDDFLKF